MTASGEAIAGSRSCRVMGNAVCTYTGGDDRTLGDVVLGRVNSCRADRSVSFCAGGAAVGSIIVGLDDLHLYYTRITPRRWATGSLCLEVGTSHEEEPTVARVSQVSQIVSQISNHPSARFDTTVLGVTWCQPVERGKLAGNLAD